MLLKYSILKSRLKSRSIVIDNRFNFEIVLRLSLWKNVLKYEHCACVYIWPIELTFRAREHIPPETSCLFTDNPFRYYRIYWISTNQVDNNKGSVYKKKIPNICSLLLRFLINRGMSGSFKNTCYVACKNRSPAASINLGVYYTSTGLEDLTFRGGVWLYAKFDRKTNWL